MDGSSKDRSEVVQPIGGFRRIYVIDPNIGRSWDNPQGFDDDDGSKGSKPVIVKLQ